MFTVLFHENLFELRLIYNLMIYFPFFIALLWLIFATLQFQNFLFSGAVFMKVLSYRQILCFLWQIFNWYRDGQELELDFKRYWEEFRTSSSEKVILIFLNSLILFMTFVLLKQQASFYKHICKFVLEKYFLFFFAGEGKILKHGRGSIL